MQGGLKSKKNWVKLACFSWIAVLGVIGLSAASRWFGGINQSEETNAIFNAAAKLPAEMLESVEWEPDRPDLRRKMEPLTRVDVTSAWLRAWEQLSIVAQTGDTTGLEVYFSNSALEGLLASVEATNGLPVHQLSHRLRVDFYAQDGQVIGLTAPEIHTIRAVEVGGVRGWVQTKESYEAVLLLEDGNFRIQHWVRHDMEQRWWTEPAPDPLVEEGAEAPPLPVNGINYYPQATPFGEFWPNYDPNIVAADLDRIAALGIDSVRIFLDFDQFNGRWVVEEDLIPVLHFMDLAEDRDLGVVVTLFDGRTDHRSDKWDSDRQHIKTVVPLLSLHPALMMWDLKNEPDRDIGKNGVEEQMMYAWLTHVAHEVREADPETPMTIGWATADGALAAPVVTDVVSFHYYGPAAELGEVSRQVIEHADGRPVLLTEYGLPTWNSVFPGGHTEAEQEVYVAETLKQARDAGLHGTMIWTLWDFAAPPPDAGSLPASKGAQVTLGVLRADGTAKPAAALLAPGADLDAIEPLGWSNRLAKRFWQALIGGMVALFSLWWVGGRLRETYTVRGVKLGRESEPTREERSQPQLAVDGGAAPDPGTIRESVSRYKPGRRVGPTPKAPKSRPRRRHMVVEAPEPDPDEADELDPADPRLAAAGDTSS